MLFGERRDFESPLIVDHDPGEVLGLLLSPILLVIFYLMLTKPLAA